jgi:hypothetical protein
MKYEIFIHSLAHKMINKRKNVRNYKLCGMNEICMSERRDLTVKNVNSCFCIPKRK